MIVTVAFPVMMYVRIDTESGVLSSIVETPNVSTMAQASNLSIHGEDFRTIHDDDVFASAILALDSNEWPTPTLVA